MGVSKGKTGTGTLAEKSTDSVQVYRDSRWAIWYPVKDISLVENAETV